MTGTHFMRAIQLYQTGGPEVLGVTELPVPVPGPGEILLHQHAIGLNYADVYQRSGVYPVALPAIPGVEGAGVVEAVGEGVSRFQAGDRVAYGGPIGAYAEMRLLRAEMAIQLPNAIDFATAAAVTLKGLTAGALMTAYPLCAGETCLVWAAAGGVGTLLCQWARARGARVIGVTSGAAKMAHALSHGCDEVLDHAQGQIPERVRALTGGKGVAVAYDGVGKASFEASRDSLAVRGMLVSFGHASGPPPLLDVMSLGRAGSLYVTRMHGGHYHLSAEELARDAAALFDAIATGAIVPVIERSFALEEAAQAHRLLETSRTIGSTILLT